MNNLGYSTSEKIIARNWYKICSVKQEDLEYFKRWFSDFCKSFYTPNAEDQKNILLKEEHTFNVCDNMDKIAGGLSLDEGQRLVAETVALYHDVGRFPQYAAYKTFRDSISVNHGILGAETLIEKKVLADLPPSEREIVIQSVKFHNAFSVPRNEPEEIAFYIRLVRDADKLDIWRVFLEYYESPAESKASAVGLGLPDVPDCSKDVLPIIYERRVVPLSMLKTLNDFRLLQLSWIFDMNFRPSFLLLEERDYINRILSHLPQTEEIRKAGEYLKEYVKQKVY
ncbi:MAG: HD domain-containing protein [Nitrospirota bacterium]